MNLVLTKESAPSEIQVYFEKVLELSKSDEQFPVDLDEVWPLVYGQKGDATNSLKRDFIDGVDYVAFRQNPKRGAASPITYKLSTSCLEYFIARKVRPVFDVYRKVFHKAAKPLSQVEIIAQSAQILLEQDKRINKVEGKVEMLEAKISTRPDYFTVAAYARINGISLTTKTCAIIGRKASDLCKNYKYEVGKVRDERWGFVGSYPVKVLDEIINQPMIF